MHQPLTPSGLPTLLRTIVSGPLRLLPPEGAFESPVSAMQQAASDALVGLVRADPDLLQPIFSILTEVGASYLPLSLALSLRNTTSRNLLPSMHTSCYPIDFATGPHTGRCRRAAQTWR